MKKSIFLAALAVLALSSTSCNDILDIKPSDQYSSDAIWSTETSADYYIMASYQHFKDHSILAGHIRHYYDAYTDLYKSTAWLENDHMYNKEFMLASQFGKNNAADFASWGTAYGRIKRANLLLNDLDRFADRFDPEWVKIRRAEVRFAVAMNYFYIARVYGGFVIRTDKSGVNGGTDDGQNPEDCNRARATEAESYDFIMKTMCEAAEDLPESWGKGGTLEGRATKGMVYGFLSRVALFAKDWEMAANAADSCAKYGHYKLVDNYADLFDYRKDQSNLDEIIYAIYYKEELATHGFDNAMRSPGDAIRDKVNPTAYIVPTAELADMYEFKDGQPFNWATWERIKVDGKSLSDPYTSREPRFQATILYDGAEWEGRTIQTYVGLTSAVPDGVDKSVTWSRANTPKGYTCTGYYIRKYLMEDNKDFRTKGSINTEICLRYGEVLLNKAEGLGMQGRIAEALVPLNEVRARVGLPARTIEDAPNVSAFMNLLRKERVCELAGEGQRYWDLIRWELAKEIIDGKSFHGVEIKLGKSGSKSYKEVDIDDGQLRMFEDRYYRLSLPADELTNNKLAIDNPGW
ncbi:MAG: RagB/SusD family nutrient uptake outer membrane protein [Muribaculaceae bacterium]|nr:RagB/SusD family nutrient uptake outer membrane protein [Muribaculaceae bacterium]